MRKKQAESVQKNGVFMQNIKGSNLAVVFNQIFHDEQITRAEIGRRANIDPAAVTAFVQDLIAHNLVVEGGPATLETVGRRPIMLKVNPEGGYGYSVKLQSNGFTLAVYDILCRQIWAKEYIDDYKDIAGSVLTALTSIPINKSLEGRHCLGISVGFPGLFSLETGETLSVLIPRLGQTDLFDRLNSFFDGKSVVVRNDSAFIAYAEQQFGIGKGVSDMVSISIGEGIGAGIIHGGHILSPPQGHGIEFGHTTIDVNGPLCKCGVRGCFNVMSNIISICRSVNEALEQGKESSLRATFKKVGAVNLLMIGQALDDGDQLIVDVLERHALLIAHAINNISNIIHPELVVINGEITTLGPRFLEMIRKRLASMRLTVSKSNFRLEFSDIDNNSTLLGGAKYLIDNVLFDGDFFSRLTQCAVKMSAKSI